MRFRLARACVVAFVVACSSSTCSAETFARSRNGAEFDAGDVVACSGAPLREFVVGRVMCVRQPFDVSALPRVDVDGLTADVRVWVNDEPQIVRGEPRITTDGVTFSFVPNKNVQNGTLTVASTIEPKARVSAGYYDVVWYELSVVWPTFFSALAWSRKKRRRNISTRRWISIHFHARGSSERTTFAIPRRGCQVKQG